MKKKLEHKNYAQLLIEVFKEHEKKSKKQILDCAKLMAKTLEKNNLIYVFGSGHSSMLAEEAFHRAGGLVPVYPILHSFLSPHVSPKIASQIERTEGIAKALLARASVKKGDLIFIVSQSGINAAGIEMALEAKKKGLKTIALTSLTHSKSVRSRHSSGKKLYEITDHVIDNRCPAGDAIVKIGNQSVGPTSSLVNFLLYNWAVTETCRLLASKSKRWRKVLPVYQSANTFGGDEHNESLEVLFRSRIPLI
ncbi:MAG: sugar isomerase domain-containing protein [Bacteriovoracia bacterium]